MPTLIIGVTLFFGFHKLCLQLSDGELRLRLGYGGLYFEFPF
jgi:hypothetical protein